MKEKQQHLRNASFLALAFAILGYAVKFYPEQLTGFDSSIQSAIRGTLPALATQFWTTITVLGNTVVIFGIALLLAFFFYQKNWKAESYFVFGGLAVLGLVSTAMKYLYQRPRPSIEWLIQTIGYSFPSWHTASTLLVAGILVIILHQRMKAGLRRSLFQLGLLLLAVLVGVSRIYVGVHYPSDILGGWLLSLCLLELFYPYYDRLRFQWRFQSKQS